MSKELWDGAPLPHTGAVVELHWMDGAKVWTTTARVAGSGARSIRVILADPEPAAALPDARRVALVYRVDGITCQARARPVEDGDVVSLELMAPARPKEAREFPRVTARIGVLATMGRAAARGRGLMPVPMGAPQLRRVSLSASGMVVPLDFTVKHGDLVDMLLELDPGDSPMAIQGRVIGVRSDGAAVHFERPSQSAEERLSDFVQRCYLGAMGASD